MASPYFDWYPDDKCQHEGRDEHRQHTAAGIALLCLDGWKLLFGVTATVGLPLGLRFHMRGHVCLLRFYRWKTARMPESSDSGFYC
jgi:hypothetical protein